MKNEENGSTENGKGCLSHHIFKVHLKSTQDYCKAPLSSLGRTSPHFHTTITPLPTLAGSLHCVIHTAFVSEVSTGAVKASCVFSELSFSSSSLVSFFLFFFLHGLYRLCVQTHMNTMSRIRKTNPATTHAMTIFFRSSTRRSRSRYSHRVPMYPVSHLHEGVFCAFTKRQTPWIQ